ncbi:MAG: NAD(P)-binding domain-containing protein, partial [Gammaproteobacteria bacterium]|nr:NAD(P)-binding domain-containing protein [Gammaproteobacteria bacterium]
MSISEKEMIIGLISPGSMGASLGAALMKPGVSVCWSSEGRSQASCDRARKAGLKDLGALENLCAASDI